MGVDIRLYREGTGLFDIRKFKLFVYSYIINTVKSAHAWIFRLMAAVTLTVGGAQLNPRLQIEEKLITSWWKREKR
jgi:hypothetical protein